MFTFVNVASLVELIVFTCGNTNPPSTSKSRCSQIECARSRLGMTCQFSTRCVAAHSSPSSPYHLNWRT